MKYWYRPQKPQRTLENIMQVKEVRHKGHILYDSHVCQMSEIGKSIEAEGRLVVARDWGAENRKWLFSGLNNFFWVYETK